MDDEQSMLEFLGILLSEAGYEVVTAASVAEGRERYFEDKFNLVLCDMIMPDGNGLDLLVEMKKHDARLAVIMMTAYTSTKTAVEAMKRGAYDYVSKPFDVEELKVVVQKALEKSELEEENVYLRRELEQKYRFSNIIGRSRPMQEIFALIERIAKTSSTVLVEGDSGTGKELIARAIHYESPRASSRFLSINCGALPEGLLESELFGHVRGAFTGAVRDKQGLFREAHRGTLFLDEIAEMPPPMQVKLLRVLQDKQVRKVGGNLEEPVDVRIIAATNQDLHKAISEGSFREDLYYRINVIPVRIPPLRQRREDIPLLVDFFLKKMAGELGVGPKRISVEAMRILEGYDWPGNVRELENIIERALALTSEETLGRQDLPMHLLRPESRHATSVTLPADGMKLEDYLDEIRKELMGQALHRNAGVQTQAADLVGMSFRSFRYYAKKLRLTSGEGEPDQAGPDQGDPASPTG